MIVIKRCDKIDAPVLARLERDNMEKPWTEKMILDAFESGNYIFLKAVEGEETVGYLSATICLDECELCNIAVDKEYRRKGVGSLLLSALSFECNALNATIIFLEVNEYNEGAIALYRKHNFVEISRRNGYYGYADAIIMSKAVK